MSAKFVLRMTAPMIAISFLLLAVGVGSAWYVHRLQTENSELLALDVSSMLAAEDIVIKMREVRSRLNRYLREGNSSALNTLPALRKEIDNLLAAAKASARSETEFAFIREIDDGCHEFFATVESARRSASPQDEIVDLLSGASMERGIFDPSRQFVDYHRNIVEHTGRQSQVMADRMGVGLALLGVCGSAAGLLAGFGIARGVSRSIVQLSIPVHGAAGKLNEVVGPITFSAPAGFDELETTLQAMADHIGTVVERLEQREREVLRGEQLAAVGQLAAGIAHELRNPLMAIKILVQSASDRGDGGLHGRDLSVVEEEIGRLDGSIQALLDFARPPEPAMQVVDVRQLIGQTVDLVSARAEQQRVALISRAPAGPALVEADGGQIRQVLLNLMLNALDALPDGGRLSIDVNDETGRRPSLPDTVKSNAGEGSKADGEEAAPSEPGRNGYLIRLADNGVGLPPELGDRIFEPFVSTKETGTGLGLPICRRIIEAHGGEITAANAAEGGAVFLVWLPSAATLETGGAAADRPQPAATPRSCDRGALAPHSHTTAHTESSTTEVLIADAASARNR